MTSVRVVSYNLLTPNYAKPQDLKLHPPAYVDPESRYKRIFAQIEAEVKKGSIICLQEVNRDWAGRLHAYFANNEYHFAYTSYGRPSSGYFGVGVAWSMSTWESLGVDMTRVAESKDWPTPPPPPSPVSPPAAAPSPVSWATDLVWDVVMGSLRLVRAVAPPPCSVDEAAQEMWDASQRQNVAVSVHLRARASGQAFWICTYHMPCDFRRPRVMTLHAALVAQHIQRLAGGGAHILCGDFNLKPDSPQYAMLTSGAMPDGHHDRPMLPCNDTWQPRLDTPLKSALSERHGKEPEFTCYAFPTPEGGERFIDTLDYIFLSSHWTVTDASTHRTQAEALRMPLPFPNDVEPSDHVLIHADLQLND